jgi:hypothetical protein
VKLLRRLLCREKPNPVPKIVVEIPAYCPKCEGLFSYWMTEAHNSVCCPYCGFDIEADWRKRNRPIPPPGSPEPLIITPGGRT